MPARACAAAAQRPGGTQPLLKETSRNVCQDIRRAGNGTRQGHCRHRRRPRPSQAAQLTVISAWPCVVIATAQLMVVLDATIVNVALPDIQKALGFSGSGLEWVVNAYALTFGGLLLLGGRAGDILGRRRVFIAGIILFSVASLLGGFATSEAWLLAARALQGVGGAIVAPTALSLITTTFPEGPPRNRAMGVYAAMSIGGAAVGLMAGGLLTTYLSWRWVLFVNVPIGVVVVALLRAAGARRVGRRRRPAAGSTCPARSPARSAWPPWSTACPARRRPPTASRTGVTPRCSPRWWRRSCCSPRSSSSSRAASTR